MHDIFEQIFSKFEPKSILCLNGSIPGKAFFKNFKNRLPIIAADGATNRLMKIGIKPDIIIGDLDSVDSKYLEFIPNFKNSDQSTSDFEKTLEYTKAKMISPSIIVGLGGGYLDHILNNINIFTASEFIAFSDSTVILNITSSLELKLPTNTKISLFGMPEACITTTGLKWNLCNDLLTFPGKNSALNRSYDENIRITVKEGILLCIIYLKDIRDAAFSSKKVD